MKIVVTGTRGIPGIPGGIENHCQQLYPLVVGMGHEVVVVNRRPYVVEPALVWRGVHMIDTWCPRGKHLETIVHTFAAILRARRLHADLVHIHAIGPGLLVPLARLMGLRVVLTNHGPDYERKKWGAMAKAFLSLGEYLGGTWANEVIVISRAIGDRVGKRCGRPVHLIPNGAPQQGASPGSDLLPRFGIPPSGRYILAVARLVPEKELQDLVEAFGALEGDVRLVIAGGADHETEYSRHLRARAGRDARISMPGYVTGEPLRQLYAHASLFVLPSSHEGHPITLLEAMSYGLPVLVSDIPANKGIALPGHCYFACGDTADLREKMQALLQRRMTAEERASFEARVAAEFDWRNIAERTVAVYHQTLGRPGAPGPVGSRGKRGPAG